MAINKKPKILIVALGLLAGCYVRGLTDKDYYAEALADNKEAVLDETELFRTQRQKMRDYLKRYDRQGLKDMMITSIGRRKLFDR